MRIFVESSTVRNRIDKGWTVLFVTKIFGGGGWSCFFLFQFLSSSFAFLLLFAVKVERNAPGSCGLEFLFFNASSKFDIRFRVRLRSLASRQGKIIESNQYLRCIHSFVLKSWNFCYQGMWNFLFLFFCISLHHSMAFQWFARLIR